MPALRWCGRRWACGSDDLVFPQIWLAMIVGGFVVAVLVAFPRVEIPDSCEDADERRTTRYWLYAHGGVSAAIFLLAIAVAFIAGQGTPFETKPRASVGTMLWLEQLLMAGLAGTSGWGTYLFMYDDYCSDAKHSHLLTSFVICGWTVVGLVLCTMCCCFDHTNRHVGETMSEGAFEDYAEMWSRRCRRACLLRPCVPNTEDDALAVDFGEVGSILAAVFRGLDLVPSDIAAGLVLLRSRQQQQRMERQELSIDQLLPPLAQVSPNGREVRYVPQHLKVSSETRRLQPVSPDCAAALEDFDLFSNHALAAYGWMMQLFVRPVRGVCRLTSAVFRGACGIPVQGGNCCGRLLSGAALVAEGVGEVIQYHNSNDIALPVWYLAVDHQRSAIVVGVRGTMSASDILTDGAATPTEFAGGLAHKGFAYCARRIYAKLREGEALRELRQQYPSYRIVILGHSMGAGVAGLLAVLLRPHFPGPEFRCLAYATPGGLMSRELADSTKDYIWALCVGKDLVPRLGLRSLEKFRDQLLDVMTEAQRAKCTIMGCCCTASHQFYFGPRKRGRDQDAIVGLARTYLDATREQRKPELVVPMYPPSALLLLSKVCIAELGGCCGARKHVYYPQFIDTEELQEIISSPAMVLDHLPDREQVILRGAMVDMQDGVFDRLGGTGGSGRQQHERRTSMDKASQYHKLTSSSMLPPVNESTVCRSIPDTAPIGSSMVTAAAPAEIVAGGDV
eukprot:TRINITY_DN10636_c0_g1_i1.p1 TRINITY_DN10636_c0_g1~~TRINITY_DN10636_c0_g1_i1.p1  ORF type:complete len:734 (+),score=139.36 TRINITY_DN10636_c0_g1_i1:82-2283(+)